MIPHAPFKHILNHSQDYKIIPDNFCASNNFEMTFKGWTPCTIDINDPFFSNLSKFASMIVDNFIELHKDTHAFTHPQFHYRPDSNVFGIKIGTLEIERYEKLIKEKK